MTLPDAVAVYGLFGPSIEAIFSVLRFAVTLLILYLAIRIPFKRPCHWMFIVLDRTEEAPLVSETTYFPSPHTGLDGQTA